MSTGSVLDPTGPLAPSELVLLRGDQFAKKTMLGNVRLLHTEESVSLVQLGEAILAAAFLACHEAGSIQLRVRPKKALFGLRRVDRLQAMPGDPAVAWPAATLEATIGRMVQDSARDDGLDIRDLVYRWLAQDSASPWQAAVDRIKAGLAERGLLNRFDEKRLKIFTVTRYELPPATDTLAAGQPLEPVRRLLELCAEERPAVWRLLAKEIGAAISARTEKPDTDD
jgi:hypothetical protein